MLEQAAAVARTRLASGLGTGVATGRTDPTSTRCGKVVAVCSALPNTNEDGVQGSSQALQSSQGVQRADLQFALSNHVPQ